MSKKTARGVTSATAVTVVAGAVIVAIVARAATVTTARAASRVLMHRPVMRRPLVIKAAPAQAKVAATRRLSPSKAACAR